MSDITAQDRLYGALSYATLGAVGVLALLSEPLRSRPFVKYHAAHSIALSLPVVLIGFTGALVCLAVPAWLVMLALAYRTYQGRTLVVPALTDFLTNRGWA